MVSEEYLKELVAARGYAKAFFTRLHNFLKNSNEMKNISANNLLERKKKLEKTFGEYEELNKKISFLYPEDNEPTLEIENRYFELLSSLNELIGIHGEASADPPLNHTNKTKLPVINIGSFNGKYADNISFINLFKSLIDNDKSLDKVQKLHYLRSFTKDEPFELIKNLSLTSDSYDEALKLLDDRYYNKFRIITEHVNELLDLSAVTRSTSSCIREFVSKIKQNLAALNNLSIDVSRWDPILINIVTRKLDTYTSRAYQLERDQSTEPSMKQLLEFLEKRALALENSTTNSSPAKNSTMQKAVHLATEATVAAYPRDAEQSATEQPDFEQPSCVLEPVFAADRITAAQSSSG